MERTEFFKIIREKLFDLIENKGFNFTEAQQIITDNFLSVLRDFFIGKPVSGPFSTLLFDLDTQDYIGLMELLSVFHLSLGFVHSEFFFGEKGTDPMGIVPTPLKIARKVVKDSLKTLGRTPSIVVDPAVGSGVFLLAFILEFKGEEALFIGVDLDPIAIKLSSFLVDILKNHFKIISPKIVVRLQRGDALMGLTLRELERFSLRLYKKGLFLKKRNNYNMLYNLLHMGSTLFSSGDRLMMRAAPVINPSLLVPHSTGVIKRLENFSLLRPIYWDLLIPSLKGADLIIGNPPWAFLSGKKSPFKRLEEKGFYKEHHELRQRIQFYKKRFPEISSPFLDIHKWFCALTPRILQPDGVMGYVIPDSVLYYPSFSDLRAYFSKEYELGSAEIFNPFNDIRARVTSLVLKRGLRDGLKVKIKDKNRVLDVTFFENGSFYNASSLQKKISSWKKLGDIITIKEGSHSIPSPKKWRIQDSGIRAVDVSKMERFFPPRVVNISINKDVPKKQLIDGQVGLWRKTGDKIITSVIELEQGTIIHQNVYLFKTKGFSPYALTVIFNSSMYAKIYEDLDWARSSGSMAQFRLSYIKSLPFPDFALEITNEDKNTSALQTLSISEMLKDTLYIWMEEGTIEQENNIHILEKMLLGIKDGLKILLKNKKPIPRTVHTIFHTIGEVLHKLPKGKARDLVESISNDMVELLLE